MNKKNLIETLAIQTISGDQWNMIDYITKRIEATKEFKQGSLVYDFDSSFNLYITKGVADNFPCVVSHMDTVHELYKDFKIYEQSDCLFSWDGELKRQVGIGGDDKVGVFVTLEALEKFDNIKVAFFVDEEIGCVGSREADMEWFDDVGFVLQCDRKGYGDFVNSIGGTKLYGKDFSEAIAEILTSYKYEETSGGITDVGQLKENDLKVACANMSCGYYNPHTSGEYVDITDVTNVLNMVLDIIEKVGGQRFPHKYEKPTYVGYGGYGGYGRGWEQYDYSKYNRNSWSAKPKKKKKSRKTKSRLSTADKHAVVIGDKSYLMNIDEEKMEYIDFDSRVRNVFALSDFLGTELKSLSFAEIRRLYQKTFKCNPAKAHTKLDLELQYLNSMITLIDSEYKLYSENYKSDTKSDGDGICRICSKYSNEVYTSMRTTCWNCELDSVSSDELLW